MTKCSKRNPFQKFNFIISIILWRMNNEFGDLARMVTKLIEIKGDYILVC
jgi:hypothetical protein